MNLFTYRLLTYIGLPLIALSGWKRCKKHKKAVSDNPNLPEIPCCCRSRFGFNATPMQKGGIWIHAVSIGETRSIFPLLQELHSLYPDLPITLTNSSVQGAIHAQEFCPVKVQQHMLPFDYPFAIKRFLQQIQPKLVLMVETEIWPNLYQACHEQNIPIALINARLKKSSFQAYKKWGGKAIKDALNQTQFISAQTETDAERFKQLGAEETKIKVLGNLKSDISLDENLIQNAFHWREQNAATNRPIWVAASTHADPEGGESEESLVLKAHQLLLKQHPNALLILVPRHQARFNEVAELINSMGLGWQRRTDGQALNDKTKVYLADTLGEMMLWYAVADIAFVGGSLVPFGGHNILEPAALQKPILSGPHYSNLESMYQPFREQKAITLCDDSAALAKQLEHYIDHSEAANDIGKKAWQCFASQTGALQKTLDAISQILAKNSEGH